jgi:hypothetical protein
MELSGLGLKTKVLSGGEVELEWRTGDEQGNLVSTAPDSNRQHDAPNCHALAAVRHFNVHAALRSATELYWHVAW